MKMFIGFAKDIHNLQKNIKKPLILGGKVINNSEYSICAHSDGDLILHAISSSILGAMSESITLGDLFSDADEKNKDMDSSIIIQKVLKMMQNKQLQINNIDIIIVCEKIYLKNYLYDIKTSLMNILKISNIGIKCTRFENQNNDQIECDVIVSLINL